MANRLPPELSYILNDVVARRGPTLQDAVAEFEGGWLTPVNKQALIRILTDEFCSTGLREDGEPSGRGIMIEDLIDRINGLRL
jgi:hypothetical protein